MSNEKGNRNEHSVAIIGAGLAGGGVLRELALGWAHRQAKGVDVPPDSFQLQRTREFDVDVIHITAISEGELLYQFQKTQDLLSQVPGITITQSGFLNLILSYGSESLRIMADVLNIVPPKLTSGSVEDEFFRRGSDLYAYLNQKRPQTVIIGANLAAIVAYTKELNEVRTLMLAWLLTTLKRAADELGIETVAVIGTTALGGQGTNMIWTHQSSHEMDANLTSKILAAYGILGVLDRISWDTDSATRWILITPGSLLGYDYLDFGPVKYFSLPEGMPGEVEEEVRGSDLSIPLYRPIRIDLETINDAEIDWAGRRIVDAFLGGAKVKCGETGDLSPLQFASIAHSFQMGFTTDVYVAKVLIDELSGVTTGYNQIPLGSGKVLEPTASGQTERQLALERMAELELEHGKRSAPVYPALGSPRAQKEIVLADLLFRTLSEKYGEVTIQQIGDYNAAALANELWKYLERYPEQLAEITSVIPVLSPDGALYTGPHVMYLNKGVTCTADLAELTNDAVFREFAILGAVDLRAEYDFIERKPRIYETGVETLIRRAVRIGQEYVGNYAPQVVDKGGSAIDPRIRHWWTLTAGSQTLYDPAFFVIQFLGGERPYL